MDLGYAHSSRGKKAGRPPSFAAGQRAASPVAFGLSIAIEAVMGAVTSDRLEHTMATIGTFTNSGGTFIGAAKTLSTKATIKAAEKANNKAPDYGIFANQAVEIGAAWKNTTSEGHSYLSIKLDDPSFAAPIYATMVENEGDDSYSLIRSRRNGD